MGKPSFGRIFTPLVVGLILIGGRQSFAFGRKPVMPEPISHLISLVLPQASIPTPQPQPTTSTIYTSSGLPPSTAAAPGELCPVGSNYDSANCYLGSPPAGTKAFIYNGAFYHTPLSGNRCASNTTFDGANCLLRWIPSAYSGFIYNNSWYTGVNPRFVMRSTTCPSGSTYDGANCYVGSAPSGHEAKILLGTFGFKRSGTPCGSVISGSKEIFPGYCYVKAVPGGVSPFIYNNSWYTGTVPGAPGKWFVKENIKDSANDSRPVCRADSPARHWTLVWGEEFDPKPEGTRCYNTDERLWCMLNPWTTTICPDGPTQWSSAASANWTADQKIKYGGLRDLDKCHWVAHDDFDSWEGDNPANQKTSNFHPKTMKIENGVLRMRAVANAKPPGGYDCGREQGLHPDTQGPNRTKNCAYSGGMIESPSLSPWIPDHRPDHPDPTKRYVGRNPGYGRIEFRANVERMGHGAWPALWMFVDQKKDQSQGAGELDALEYLADFGGDPNQIVKQSASSGNAIQTAHNWGVDSAGYPHTSEGVGIPIRIGEWHTYAVEYEPDEIRFYIDGCMRNRIVEGQQVKLSTGGTRPFHIPRDQTYTILVGNPISAASWLPDWYKAWGGGNMDGRSDWISTTVAVDYVRYYTDLSQKWAKTEPRVNGASRSLASESGPQSNSAVSSTSKYSGSKMPPGAWTSDATLWERARAWFGF